MLARIIHTVGWCRANWSDGGPLVADGLVTQNHCRLLPKLSLQGPPTSCDRGTIVNNPLGDLRLRTFRSDASNGLNCTSSNLGILVLTSRRKSLRDLACQGVSRPVVLGGADASGHEFFGDRLVPAGKAGLFGKAAMKRLWMRLGLLAGILATGGAGALVANRDPDEASSTPATAEAPKAPEGPERPEGPEGPTEPAATSLPITFSGAGLGPDEAPTSGAIVRADESQSGYNTGAPVQPASDYTTLPGQTLEEPTRLPVGELPNNSYSEPAPYSNPVDYAAETAPPEAGYANRYAQETSPAGLRAPEQLTPTASEASVYDAPIVEKGYADDLQELPPLPTGLGAEGDGPSTYAVADDAPPEDNLIAPPGLPDVAPSPQASYGPPGPDPYSGPSVSDNVSAPIVAAPVVRLFATGDSPDAPAPSVGAAPATTAAVGDPALASDLPGDRQLEGIQAPSLTLEKRLPSEISVGQETTFELIVHNVGKVAARGVVVTDRVPDGTQLVDASPEFTQTSDGALAWVLGDIEPGDRATVTMDLLPLKEGEIGSIAQVSFQAQASARTVSTKPGLVVEHSGPEKVLKGEDVIFNITLRNPGSGVTTGIVIEEDVPEGLVHLAGSALEYEVGTLRPREEKKLQLILKADKARVVKNVLRARADAGLQASSESTLEVVAPDLQVAIGGPKTRYLERQVTYEIAVANPGTATAYDIQLVTILPRGLKFVSADNKGSYDPRQHAVYWSLAELPAQDQGSVKFTALPVETGEQKLRLEGTGNLGLQTEYEHITTVEALTELAFTVQDTQDPIEVGADTTYEVRVVNNGNKAATNVQLAAVFPPALTPLRGDGPTKVVVEGQQVMIVPIDKIAGRDEVVYRIAAKGTGAGDHIIAVQIISDEVPTPVVKQESTKVYADQ